VLVSVTSNEPLTIAVFDDESHAHLVAGRLAAEGIEARVVFTNAALSYGGSVQLQVSAADELRARELLRELGSD
jgi:hypothetical protein